MIFLDQRLQRLAYVSAATREFSSEELVDMGWEAKRNNDAMRITGMLLHIEGEFFQVLEGPTATVEEVFSRICDDDRNTWVTPLLRERPFRRAFRGWSMGAQDLPYDDLPRSTFFRPDWDEVATRVNADPRHEFVGFLRRFYKNTHQLAQAVKAV